MNVTEQDLINSLLRSHAYLNRVLEDENISKDVEDMFDGKRKAISKFQNMDHIVGASDLQYRAKAQELRYKAVNHMKAPQLKR